MKIYLTKLKYFWAISILIFASSSFATPAGLTFQGRLVKNDLPVEGASVNVVLKVTSSSTPECVLYEETHGLNMVSSDGIFSVKIGAGTRTSNDKGLSLVQVFSNTGVALTGLTCAGAGSTTSYTPASGDARNIYVSFDDGVDTVAFSSPYVIQSVPYALEAQRLAGKDATDFLQVTVDTTQTKLNDLMATAAYTELFALITGTSTQYTKPGGGSFSANVDLNSHRITELAAPTAATDATNKQYVDSFVGGKAADTATLTALAVGDSGKTLTWSGTQWTATAPTTAVDGTKLPLAGGTMTGALVNNTNSATTALAVTQSGAGHAATLMGGNVGIGTNSPSARLQVSASNPVVNINDTRNQDGYTVGDAMATLNFTSQDSSASGNAGTARAAIVGYYDSASGILGGMQFWTKDSSGASGISEKMRITSSGNVGIGTTTPTRTLSFSGNAARTVWMERNSTADTAGNNLTIQAGGSTSAATDKNGGGLILSSGTATGTGTSTISLQTATAQGSTNTTDNAPTTKLTILGSGNVGIGTASPTRTLHVNYTATNNPNVALFQSADSTNNKSNIRFRDPSTSGGAPSEPYLGSAGNDLSFYTGDTTRLHILATGNIGIGTTSPSVTLDLGSRTDALRLPNGTTAQQPGTPAAGMLRYNTNSATPPGWVEFYNGSAWVNLASTSSGGFTGISSVTGSGNLTLSGLTTATSSVIVGNTTSSIGSASGALVVNGGLGVGGDINTGASINAGSTISAVTSVRAPSMIGSTSASGNLTLDSTSNATKGNIILAPTGGNVGIGTASPGHALHLFSSGSGSFVQENDGTAMVLRRTSGGAGFQTGAISFHVGSRSVSSITVNQEGGTDSTSGGVFSLSTRPVSGSMTERLRIDSTGNVGIATTSPAAALDVNGSFRTRTGTNFIAHGIAGSDGAIEIGQGRTADGNAYIDLIGDTTYTDYGGRMIRGSGANADTAFLHRGTANFRIVAQDAGGVQFATNNLNRMTINSSGNVGIGTTSPSVLFEVNGDVKVTSSTTASGTTSGALVVTGGIGLGGNVHSGGTITGTLVQAVASNNNAYNSSSGASALPHTGAPFLQASNMQNQDNTFASTYLLARNSSSNIQRAYLSAVSNTGAGVYTPSIVIGQQTGVTSYSERMRIDSAGNVGIGSTGPASKLEVNGAITSTAVSNASTTIDFSTGNLQYTSSNCGALTLNNMKSGGAYQLAIQGTGGGTCSFTAWSGTGTGALTVKTGSMDLVQASSTHLLISFTVMGSTAYVATVTGY